MQVDSSSGSAVWVHPIDIHLASQVMLRIIRNMPYTSDTP